MGRQPINTSPRHSFHSCHPSPLENGEGNELRRRRKKGVRIWTLVFILILGFCHSAFAQTTFDPLSVGVGARALGMGKAYVAVAEDGDTIFTNPAGLGEIDAFQFTTMSGTILEEVNYTVFGGVYPIGNKGAIGIGYASAGIGGIELRDGAGTLIKKTSFENRVIFLSYGRKVTDRFSLGLNIKLYNQNAQGDSTGNGSGTNLDIAFLQRDVGWLSFGAVGQNILSSSKIQYKNGEAEDLPRILKVGAKMYVLGEKFRAAQLSPIELSVVVDADLGLQSSQPTSTHIGAELSPSPFITFRTGIEDKTGTFGLSLRYEGLGFHYAFHPYGNISDKTHFFSLSFDERGWPPEGNPDTFFGMLP
jgi:hypothetical protein